MSRFLAALAVILVCTQAGAGSIEPREGWAVHESQLGYKALIDSLKKAVKANGMIVVTQAGPTGAAKKRGIEIPGNRVLGVYNNKFAVRAIRLSVAAMIEAPIRFYVTENEDKTATLSYKTPSFVFAPYVLEAGPELTALALELDEMFARITIEALAN
ncbi:MAG: DUF302 domain-containing protein [Pseudomonadota bacterium]